MKNGTSDYTKWPQEDRRGFGKEETKALNKLLDDEEFDYESNKAEIQERIKMLEDENSTLRNFCQSAAISVEQLWTVLREDVQGLPVPNGVNLKDLI